MTSAPRKRLGPLVAAMSLALLLGFGMARGLQATDDLRSQLDLFSQVLFLVQQNYVDQPDNQKLIKGAIDGMLRTLDPHTVYLPPQRAERMDEEFKGEYSGIGIQFDLRDNAIVVISPLEGTPAYRLGIRAGDRIVEVDRKPLQKNLTNDDVFKLLRGVTGSTVEVTIVREDEPEPLHFSIERAKIPIESVPYSYVIRPGIGYVRIIRFSQTTGEELEKALAKLHDQGMKQLVLDLRSNSGGLLSQAVEVLDQLVPSDRLLVYTRGRIPSANAEYRSSDRPRNTTNEPVVALIDHGSASASEIVAGALQDLDRGLVAGTNSFGKGLVQNQLRLSDGSKLLLTIAKYYTPSGRLIQRDYSNKDMRDYQEEAYRDAVPTDSVLATRPRFKTAAGRTVFGGGGIYPDVVLKEGGLLTRPQIEMIQKRAFFTFATHYIATHKDVKWSRESLGRDFALSDDEWAALRKTMEESKVAVTDSVWKADRPFMVRQLRADLAQATLGSIERYRILEEDDPQLNAALELFPRASKLMALSAETPAPKTTKRTVR
ncbi:MAG: S41 family peptidase [Candidatus Eisenbacteria bacterium]|nr:S41 family peptidase [Candidatus Eisenbacteria bacterium]